MNKDPRIIDLAKIHLAKKALGMDNSVYRAMLHAIVGVDSAKTLDDSGRGKVLWHLRCLGWRSRRVRRGQERLIRKLWYELYALDAVHYPEDQALNTFVKRMTGMSGFHRLTVKQGQTVIESLKAWRQRVDPDPGGRGPGAARRPRRIEAQPAANSRRNKRPEPQAAREDEEVRRDRRRHVGEPPPARRERHLNAARAMNSAERAG